MTATLIALATPNPTETQAAQRYSEHAKRLLQEFGGKPVGRFSKQDILVGHDAPQVTLVVNFDDASQIHDFIQSDAYQALIPDREQGFLSMTIYIAQ